LEEPVVVLAYDAVNVHSDVLRRTPYNRLCRSAVSPETGYIETNNNNIERGSECV
jgi:hypothetical protein